MESRASTGHPDRNEDAALGDAGRLAAEREKQPVIHSADTAKDLEAVRKAGEKEMAAADDLKAKNVFGVLDGVSGRGSNGSGLVASRLASGKIAEIMSHMPADAGGERARRSIEAALGAAHQAVMEHKAGRPDLKEMATTADIIKLVDNGDGTFDVAYGHVGDSRIYVLDGETGRISCQTIDDGYAGHVLRDGKITREQYDQVMSAPGIDALPDNLKIFYKYRNMVSDVIGKNDEEPRFSTGVFKAKKGDRILISTDGIHDNLTQEQLADIMRSGGGVGDVVAAAAKVAASGEGRAKPDDITAALIEVGAGSPERPAASPERREEPASPEQLKKWQREMEDAGVEIALLADLRRTAVKIERVRGDLTLVGDVTAKDLEKIGRLGGVQGIDRRLRDWKAFSLSREYQLTKNEMEESRRETGLSPEQMRQEVARQQQILDWQRQVANIARASGGQETLYGASPEAMASVHERMKVNGETAAQILKSAEAAMTEADRRIKAFKAVIGAEGRLKEIADQWRLVEEQRRADQAALEEQQRRAAKSELEASTDTPAKPEGRPERRPDATPAKKPGFWRRLFGKDKE